MGLDGEEGVEEDIVEKFRELRTYLEARIR